MGKKEGSGSGTILLEIIEDEEVGRKVVEGRVELEIGIEVKVDGVEIEGIAVVKEVGSVMQDTMHSEG